jgi:MFS family permease
MNDTFNIKRFGWLFKKTLLERPMQLFGLSALALVIVFFAYIFGKAMSGFDTAQNASFLLGLVGGGCFLASTVNAYFSSNAMGSSFLTLPSSHFEKWLCGILITGVFYVAIFLFLYRLMDSTFVEIYHRSLDPEGPFFKELYEQVQIFPFNEFVAKKGFLMFLNFAGVMLIGSFYFNKASFIKVALLISGLWFFAFFINLIIAKAMINDVEMAMPYFMVWIKMGTEEGRIELPENTQKIIDIFIWYIIPTMLWVLAYLRLREKEF